MILTIDIGNTDTVLGVFRGEKLLDEWRITSSLKRTDDEVWPHVKLFSQESKINLDKITGVAIASVVPALTDVFMVMTEKYLHVEPVIISGDMPELGMTIRYDDPKKLGADRICNAVAAYAKYGGPAIVVDFGTATTYDIVSKKGEFLGGMIAPGIETAASSLNRRTAKLPNAALQFPPSVIGTNTVACIQSGIMYGALDAMEGMIRRLRDILGKNTIVITTGGFSRIIAAKSTLVTHVEPALVLQGARLIYERATQAKP
ncbi:MAG: type III pantothenate kinase [Ignavibacteriae bacterium]|nr:type III pantothenate kinase [Ignavibacteria bacterium]MBI3363969.1 type III pantothenate kinase [Ignavibacteriota bacterium]